MYMYVWGSFDYPIIFLIYFIKLKNSDFFKMVYENSLFMLK